MGSAKKEALERLETLIGLKDKDLDVYNKSIERLKVKIEMIRDVRFDLIGVCTLLRKEVEEELASKRTCNTASPGAPASTGKDHCDEQS